MGSGGKEQQANPSTMMGEHTPLLPSNATDSSTNGDSAEIDNHGGPKTSDRFALKIIAAILFVAVLVFVGQRTIHQPREADYDPSVRLQRLVHDVLSRQLQPLFSSTGSASRILYCCQDSDDDNAYFVQAATVWRQDVSASSSSSTHQQPLAVIEVYAAEDVEHAIPILAHLQRTARVPFRIRSGGHNKAGFSTVAGGIVLSLKHMNQVSLLDEDDNRKATAHHHHRDGRRSLKMVSMEDVNPRYGSATANAKTTIANPPRTVTAWIQPGATVEDILDQLLAAQGYSGAIGQCGRVAEGGWALGGGIGFMSRLLGMGLDNVLAMQVVLANGTTVLANGRHHTDLFWALRGAGSGSFGVVTGMQYQVHATPMTQLFKAVFLPLEDMGRIWYEMARRDVDGTLSPYFNVVFGGKINQTVIMAYMSWFALDDETLAQGNNYYDDEILPLVQSAPSINDEENDEALSAIWMSQRQPWQLFQWPHDTHELFDSGYGKSVWAAQVWQGFLMPVNNTPAVWQQIMDLTIPLLVENPDLTPHVELWGGRIATIDADATAFPHRHAIYNFGFQLYVSDQEADTTFREQAARVSAVWPRLAHYLTGAYVNYPMNSLSSEEYPRLYWGANLERLIRIKQMYDPDNVFSFEQSVPLKQP